MVCAENIYCLISIIYSIMKELTLKDIQNISLSILDNVHSFCVENSIKYSIAYGTLLGAVRHKGFIPWDDDIDIIMPRNDYDRFCKIYQDSDEFKLYDFSRKNSLIPYGRVCDVKVTRVISETAWTKEDTGVWIDIFPVDGVEENMDKFKAQIDEASRLWKGSWFKRGALNDISSSHSVLENVKTIIKRLVYGDSIYEHVTKQIELCKRIPFDDSKYWGNLSFLIYGTKERHQSSEFESLLLISFEGRKYNALSGYDEYLKEYYNDYMQLPPAEKRRTHSMHGYYWR